MYNQDGVKNCVNFKIELGMDNAFDKIFRFSSIAYMLLI